MPKNKAFINIVLVLFVLFLGYTACDAPKPQQQEAPQEIVKTPYKFEDERVRVADSLYSRRNWGASLPEFEKAKALFVAEEHWEGILYTTNQLAITHRRLGHQVEAKELFELSKSLVDEKFGGKHILLAQIYYYETVRNYQLREYDLSYSFVDSAFDAYEEVNVYDSALLKNIIRYKFFTYFEAGQNLDTCIKYLDIRDAIFENRNFNILTDKTKLMRDYTLYYRKVNDVERAQIYAQRGLNIISDSDVSSEEQLEGLYSLATVHFDKLEYDKTLVLAEQMIDTAIATYGSKHRDLAVYYNLKATSLSGLARFEESVVPYKKAREILQINKRTNTDSYFQNLQNTAIAFSEIGRFSEAESLYKEALRGKQKLYGVVDARTANQHYYLADFFLRNSQFKQALIYYDSALMSTTGSISEDILDIPKVSGKVSRRTLNALQGKAETLLNLYASENDKEMIEGSLKYIYFTDSILMSNRQDYQFGEGRLFLAEYFKDLYEIGLDAAFQLSKIETNSQPVDLAFDLMSKSKNVLFLDQSGEYDLVMMENVPDKLRSEYLSAMRQMENLDEELTDLLQNNYTNLRIQAINNEKMKVGNELSVMRDKLYNIQANIVKSNKGSRVNLNQIRNNLNATGERALVEYFVGEEAVYAIGLDSDKWKFHKSMIDAEHENMIDTLSKYIDQRPTFREIRTALNTYGKAAHKFYIRLLQPIIEGLNIGFEELVVIPDDYLSKIPFEAMLTSFSGDERSYRDLNYTIREFKITYMLSTQLIGFGREKSKTSKRMLGFGFSGENLGNERSNYADLPGTTEEINFLKANIPGDYFLGSGASKQVFIEKAREYSILHLAVHGEADLNNRYKSRLIFNGQNDNILKGNDLYELGLNADLVVLSACESGVGELNRGEGTFSIARSFALSGVSNLVMSLWKVDDQVASQLMVGFHENLINSNTSASSALYNSKLDYLNSADEYRSHPYYWATFVSLNGDVVIPERTLLGRYKWMLVLVVFVIFAFSALTIKKRRKA